MELLKLAPQLNLTDTQLFLKSHKLTSKKHLFLKTLGFCLMVVLLEKKFIHLVNIFLVQKLWG